MRWKKCLARAGRLKEHDGIKAKAAIPVDRRSRIVLVGTIRLVGVEVREDKLVVDGRIEVSFREEHGGIIAPAARRVHVVPLPVERNAERAAILGDDAVDDDAARADEGVRCAVALAVRTAERL